MQVAKEQESQANTVGNTALPVNNQAPILNPRPLENRTNDYSYTSQGYSDYYNNGYNGYRNNNYRRGYRSNYRNYDNRYNRNNN